MANIEESFTRMQARIEVLAQQNRDLRAVVKEQIRIMCLLHEEVAALRRVGTMPRSLRCDTFPYLKHGKVSSPSGPRS